MISPSRERENNVALGVLFAAATLLEGAGMLVVIAGGVIAVTGGRTAPHDQPASASGRVR